MWGDLQKKLFEVLNIKQKKHQQLFMRTALFLALALVALFIVKEVGLIDTQRAGGEKSVSSQGVSIAPGMPPSGRGGGGTTGGGYPGEYDGDSAGDAMYDEAYAEGARNSTAPSPMPPIEPGYTPGSNAEAYEVTQYSAFIRTARFHDACKTIESLKPKEYVIFENANTQDEYCYYQFKVEKANTEEVVALIDGLNPEEMQENTHSIERQIIDFATEEDILRAKLEAIEETLTDAQDAYEELTALARDAQDATALARIIDSRVNLIERLTNERIRTLSQLDRLAKQKGEALDRLKYTHFSVTVEKVVFVDGEGIWRSWQIAVRNLFFEINNLLQTFTVDLLRFVLVLCQYLVFGLLLLLVAKYGLRYGKRLWKS